MCFNLLPMLQQLNLIGHCNGLSSDEIKELWTQADIDGNGVLDHKEFKVDMILLLIMKIYGPSQMSPLQKYKRNIILVIIIQQRIWNISCSEQGEEVACDEMVNETEQTIGFKVKTAALFPTEVEKGTWPEDYSLSDHARLTVVFSPVKMPCSRI